MYMYIYIYVYIHLQNQSIFVNLSKTERTSDLRSAASPWLLPVDGRISCHRYCHGDVVWELIQSVPRRWGGASLEFGESEWKTMVDFRRKTIGKWWFNGI